ncbi:hypothetical protein BGW80DRAFT_1518694 [Lactifluus volemus]|nr:hypothetical protein BGW80DRAFT_1518694 [Lactifluus volemus]
MACDTEQGMEVAVQGVEILLTEGVDWEKIWSGSPEGDGFPFALRGPRRKDTTLLRASINHFPVFHRPSKLFWCCSDRTLGWSKANRGRHFMGYAPSQGPRVLSLLISAIEKSMLTGLAARGDGFYLGVLRDGGPWQIHHIMPGGPSHGTMALEAETAPRRAHRFSYFTVPMTMPCP